MFYGSQLDLFSIIPTLSLLPSKSGYFWLQNKQKKKDEDGHDCTAKQTNGRHHSGFAPGRCEGPGPTTHFVTTSRFCFVRVHWLVGWLFGLFVSRIVRETWMVDVGPKPAEPETGEAVRGCFKM